MLLLKRILIISLLTLFSWLNVFAQSTFVVRKIRVEGLQRVSLGTVLHYLPIKVGQQLSPDNTSSIVSALYATGFFSNVSLDRDGDTLIIDVEERPTIGAINIRGNKKIPTKKLTDILNNIGIREGNVYDSSVLQGLQESLQQQYVGQGQYNATVRTSAVPESRNRVTINIDINEGTPTRIKQIKIIGNQTFGEGRLKRQFQLTTWRPWTILTHSDQFSQDKFNADLETLHSFYLDRGFLRFKVNSAQTNFSPDNKTVCILIDITEGPVYHISGYNFSGNLLGKQCDIEKLVRLKPGETFSRAKILAIADAITHYYGNQGYAFANVTPVPHINDATREVSITFNVDPGNRVYVRNIDFTGNTKTQDIVLRREMRQDEGGLYSLSNVEEGKRRLQMLGFLQNINIQNVPVPGHPDQVDLDYHVQEMSSATASIQGGYSDMYGFLYGANLAESNFMGTGKHVQIGFQNSQYSDSYNFTYSNPYYTESGISRAFSIFAQHITPGKVNVASYTSDNYGAAVNYGIPLSEYSGLSFGYGYRYIDITQFNKLSLPLSDFINKYGSTFNQVSLNGSWMRTTYDRALFPTSGTKQVLSAEVGVPVINKSLDYYTVNYEAAWYQPITSGFIFHLNGDLGYANGYGKFSNDLPFFKNFFAGGIDSVRGYVANTLGPLDNLNNPLGGNVLTTASASLIIPNPFTDKLRPSIFVDAGNVFDNQFALRKVHYSAGIDFEVLVPMMGPLEFALAEPFNRGTHDQREHFEFSVATSF